MSETGRTTTSSFHSIPPVCPIQAGAVRLSAARLPARRNSRHGRPQARRVLVQARLRLMELFLIVFYFPTRNAESECRKATAEPAWLWVESKRARRTDAVSIT